MVDKRVQRKARGLPRPIIRSRGGSSKQPKSSKFCPHQRKRLRFLTSLTFPQVSSTSSITHLSTGKASRRLER